MDDGSKLMPLDLAKEYAEVGVDKLIEASKQYIPILSSFGEDIPYVNTLIAAVKFPRTLSDYLLGKKVYEFLYNSNLSQAKYQKFKEKFTKADQEKIWERVVFSINSHDDKLKSQIIGKLFDALVDDELYEPDFFSLVHATNSLNLKDLDLLFDTYASWGANTLGTRYAYTFATLGLVDIDNSTVGVMGGGGPKYPLNQLGWQYCGIVYDHPVATINGEDSGVRMGESSLISEIDEHGMITNLAYPLEYMLTKHKRYRRVYLYAVNEANEILCSKQSGLPIAATNAPVPAGYQPESVAKYLADDLGSKNKYTAVLTRLNDINVYEWNYIALLNHSDENQVFRARHEIMEDINNSGEQTDKVKNIASLIGEIGRFTDGELRDRWEALIN